MAFTYGTLCSGIGCADLAADVVGWERKFVAEIDPFACAVLDHRFPGARNLGDMTTVADRIAAGEVPIVDTIIAGTPCQAFSIAGTRQSLDDERGNLTLQLVRILDAMDDARERAGLLDCCTLVWENVPGVFSTKDNAFGCFLGALVGAKQPLSAFGRNGKWPRAGLVRGPHRQAAWRILDAQWFGVAQRRRRVFLVAGAGATFDPSAVLLEPECVRRDTPPSRGARQEVAGTLAASTGGCDENDAKDGRLIAYGGNNCAGPIDVATARSAHAGPHGRLDFETETFLVTGGDVTHALNTANNGKHCSEDGTGRGVPIIGFDSRQDCVSSGALGSSSPQAQAVAFLHANKGRPTGRKSAHTGMVTVETETVPTLATDGHAQSAVCAFPSTVRRLTPRECERLQGLPDDWTLLPVQQRKKIEADYLAYLRDTYPDMPLEEAERLAKDGPRYRAIGNGMAVPCMIWILDRLDRHVKGEL